VVGLELFGQAPGRRQPFGCIGLSEDEGQPIVDGSGQLLGQVPLDVLRLPAFSPVPQLG
jgi:hypothetical protein